MSGDSIPDFAPFMQEPNSPIETILNKKIRSILLNGEMYWSIFDVYHAYHISNPRCEWSRAQRRLRRQHIEAGQYLKKHQFTNKTGRRSRLTPVGSKTLIDAIIFDISLKNSIFPGNEHKASPISLTSIDEVFVFHPAVMSFFASRGCVTEHHVSLPSRKIIDIVVLYPNGKIAIVECKNRLTGDSLFEAVGQVLCYCAEYPKNATPIVACPAGKTDDYTHRVCAALDIEVLEIQICDLKLGRTNLPSYDLYG